jgi:hypothetical protein
MKISEGIAVLEKLKVEIGDKELNISYLVNDEESGSNYFEEEAVSFISHEHSGKIVIFGEGVSQ